MTSPISVTASIGAAFCGRALTAADLVRKADEMVYRSNASGRNAVSVAEE